MIDTPAIEKLLGELRDARTYGYVPVAVRTSINDAITTIRALMEAVEGDSPREGIGQKARKSAAEPPESAREEITPFNGWQPIETAPKDGTELVLYGTYPDNDYGKPTQRVTAGFWCEPDPPVVGDCGGECRCPQYGEPEAPFWCTMHGGSDSGWMSTDGGFTTDWPPTHWMPLPQPPAIRSKGDA